MVVQTCKLANIECNLAIRNQHLQYTNGGQSHLFIFMPYANEGRPLSVVRILAFTDCEAIHAKQGFWGSPVENEVFAHPLARLRRSMTN
jgi:hypothetical protein